MQEGLNLGGQPLLIQVVVAIVIGLGTLLTAYLGYRKRFEREPAGAAQTVVAAFPDMGAIRSLTDVCRVLCGEVVKLESTMRDHTHYLRDKIEVDRELCMRLREHKEEMIRQALGRG